MQRNIIQCNLDLILHLKAGLYEFQLRCPLKQLC